MVFKVLSLIWSCCRFLGYFKEILIENFGFLLIIFKGEREKKIETEIERECLFM